MSTKKSDRKYLVKYRLSDDSQHSLKGRCAFSLPRPRMSISIQGRDFNFRSHVTDSFFSRLSNELFSVEPSTYDCNFRIVKISYDHSALAFCSGFLFSIVFDFDFSFVDSDSSCDRVACGSGLVSFYDVTTEG